MQHIYKIYEHIFTKHIQHIQKHIHGICRIYKKYIYMQNINKIYTTQNIHSISTTHIQHIYKIYIKHIQNIHHRCRRYIQNLYKISEK